LLALLQRYYLVYTGLIVVQLVGWYVLAVDTNNLTLEGLSGFSSVSIDLPYAPMAYCEGFFLLHRDRTPLRGQAWSCT
jgi:hypothetical protein